MRFDELYLEDAILDGLDAMNFQEATPIQEQTIPVILEGKDLIACAQTGTGKTAAYVLPIINELSKGNHPENSVNAVIMAPTRELALQIDQQMGLHIMSPFQPSPFMEALTESHGNNNEGAWKWAQTL